MKTKMNKDSSILVIGGLGYIGINLLLHLKNQGYKNVKVIQKNWQNKWKRLANLNIQYSASEGELLSHEYGEIYDPVRSLILNSNIVILLAANSSTSALPTKENVINNIVFPRKVAELLKEDQHLIFASSASVYGGIEDNFVETRDDLIPLNFYGYSKLVAERNLNFKHVTSLRFFNVYGGHFESEKGDMCSVVTRWVNTEYNSVGRIHLFESANPNYKHGEQCRDFIHVKDIASIIELAMWKKVGGVFNAGTGKATTYLDLAREVLKQKGLNPSFYISFQSLPMHLNNQYQYRTCADIDKLKHELGYHCNFISIEDGIKETIQVNK